MIAAQEHPFAQFVRILGKGKTGSRSLTEHEAYCAMQHIVTGQVEEVQLGAFLMLLRVKEESHQELAGFVKAIREYLQSSTLSFQADLDWPSYAGKKRQLPWYLLSCFLLADQGIRVFMHGASGHTPGRLYTEEALKQLGSPIAENWQQAEQQLNDSCFSYMPLRYFCPPLAKIINLRSVLGLRSPVHTLSRLINPLSAPCSMQSIFHPSYALTHQQAAFDLQQPFAAVFKGEGGEIEKKPEATCTVYSVMDKQLHEEVWPKTQQQRQPALETMDIEHLREVWRGNREDDYAYQAIIYTAAIAIKLLRQLPSQQEAIATAKQWWASRNKDRL